MIKNKLPVEARYKLIYNPNAGKKRNLLPNSTSVSLEDIKILFEQYQIPVDYFPTKGPGDATELAKASVKEKYNYVIAAGGDGTISEVAAGLIGSEMIMGILPLGTFMNTPAALSIPSQLELAVAVIKLGRVRKIDVGVIQKINGEKLETPTYFLENAGVGLEARFQHIFLNMERGDRIGFLRLIKALLDYYAFRAKIVLDAQELSIRAGLVEISNGPMTGANLKVAPKAKLNDHYLTVSIFKMSLLHLAWYVLRMKGMGVATSKEIKRYRSKVVKIYTRSPKLVHADAKVFGVTPVVFSVLPGALNVISGFPKPGESALVKRTILDP